MWLNESVFYQIYPLGLLDAPKANDSIYVPRILDLEKWIPYFKNLGVGTILLNPIFEADTHGYDTKDFHTLDKRLGNNEDFKKVSQAFHDAGLRIVLDAVFNHVGRNFPPFLDVLEKKGDSPYQDWFYLDYNRNSNYNDGFWYEGWEGHFELVKLNLKNQKLKDYLLACVDFWYQEFNIDGLRLDVAYSLDHDFIKELRKRVASYSNDFVLIGEVLFGDYNRLVNQEMLHSCTNYECYKGIYSSLNSLNLFEIAYSLNRQFGPEEWTLYKDKPLLSFVDNHDVSRIASLLTNEYHLPLAFALLFTMPGVPCLYYGSEWGERGKKEEGDQALRKAFKKPTPNALTNFIKQLIKIRTQEKALCFGDYTNLVTQNQAFMFRRSFKGEVILVLLNIDAEPFTFYHEELNGTVQLLLEHKEENLRGNFQVMPYSLTLLKKS